MPTATCKCEAQVIPGSPGCPASAGCPHCDNIVYNDGLRLINPYLDTAGRKRFANLMISCDTCGHVNTIEFGG